MARAKDGPTSLYRFYDGSGQLLYVGVSNHPIPRYDQHGNEKPWWSEVATSKMEHHSTRDAALTAEAVAIRDERPRHNVSGVRSSRYRPLPEPGSVMMAIKRDERAHRSQELVITVPERVSDEGDPNYEWSLSAVKRRVLTWQRSTVE